MFLINWIDKKLDSLKGDVLFANYFSGIDLKEIEGSNYLSNPGKGIDIVLSKILVTRSIHLFSESSNSKKYQGDIPFNLTFSMSRSIVNQVVGIPNKMGGGHRDRFGPIPMWDKYFFEGYSLHFQYSEDQTNINLITIGSLSLEPYFNIGLQ